MVNNSRTVGVIGIGFVGEHLTKVFSQNRENNIIGYDISEKRINYLNNIYKDLSNIKFQNRIDNLDTCDLFLVSVPTDVTNKKPDLNNLIHVRNLLEKVAKKGSIIVVESSVYVGGTREIFGGFLDKGVYVGFSPERIDPGRMKPESYEISKIISGLNKESLMKIREFYKMVFSECVEVTSCETAEMCKLYENCYRVVNIAYVNEISDMCIEKGINPIEMINATVSKPFGFTPHYPGLGVGGHCLPYNPYYLMNDTELPILKNCINNLERRPSEKARELVENHNFDSVLVVGLGFKPGESLLTNSPGVSLASELIKLGKNVKGYDPCVKLTYQKTDFELIDIKEFDPYLIMENFELVIVAMRQRSVNLDILTEIEKMGMKVVYFV